MKDHFPIATSHGEIEQIFKDIYVVKGSVDMAPGLTVSRNMTIIKEDGALTLISPVRLDEKMLAKLDELGSVEHIVKLGAYHLGAQNGIDDAFYVDQYQAKVWSINNMPHKGDVKTDYVLGENGNYPNQKMSHFEFKSSKMPEAILHLDRDDGILISADSLQNWEAIDPYFSEKAGVMMQNAGFIQKANIGPEWYRHCEPQKSDFDAFLRLEFNHLLPSHGIPLLEQAKILFENRIKNLT